MLRDFGLSVYIKIVDRKSLIQVIFLFPDTHVGTMHGISNMLAAIGILKLGYA